MATGEIHDRREWEGSPAPRVRPAGCRSKNSTVSRCPELMKLTGVDSVYVDDDL